MIYVINQVKFITGLNQQFINTGFFVVKNVGILFQNIMDIPMEGQEKQINKSNIINKSFVLEIGV